MSTIPSDPVTSDPVTLDPVTLALVQNRLDHISHQMGWVMTRTARSPIFSQSHDFSCFIADARGTLISRTAGADGIRTKDDQKLALTVRTHSEDPDRKQLIQVLQSEFQKVGIDATTNTVEFPAFFQDVQDGKFQVGVIGWLNLSDPDSMTLTPSNDILLDSQGDSELILVHNPGQANQTNTRIPLSSPFGTPQADDTLFIPASEGFILVSDTPANITYKISKKRFVPGTAFTAADGAADANGNFVGFVGALDMSFGDLRPVVPGLMDPHGLGFVPARGDEGEGNGGSCREQ